MPSRDQFVPPEHLIAPMPLEAKKAAFYHRHVAWYSVLSHASTPAKMISQLVIVALCLRPRRTSACCAKENREGCYRHDTPQCFVGWGTNGDEDCFILDVCFADDLEDCCNMDFTAGPIIHVFSG